MDGADRNGLALRLLDDFLPQLLKAVFQIGDAGIGIGEQVFQHIQLTDHIAGGKHTGTIRHLVAHLSDAAVFHRLGQSGHTLGGAVERHPAGSVLAGHEVAFEVFSGAHEGTGPAAAGGPGDLLKGRFQVGDARPGHPEGRQLQIVGGVVVVHILVPGQVGQNGGRLG